jgi:hypothetical protein
LALLASTIRALTLQNSKKCLSPRPGFVVGIDDWAFRRNHSYGTIVCDLERRRIVTLLPDREMATVQAWLAAHPEINVLSRDRGGGYGEAFCAGQKFWIDRRRADRCTDRTMVARTTAQVSIFIVHPPNWWLLQFQTIITRNHVERKIAPRDTSRAEQASQVFTFLASLNPCGTSNLNRAMLHIMDVSATELKRAVEAQHGCKATVFQSVPIPDCEVSESDSCL